MRRGSLNQIKRKKAKISSKNALPKSLYHSNRMRWILINYKLQVISYEQEGKSRASFHVLNDVNLDIPFVSSKLNVIETMNTDLLRH